MVGLQIWLWTTSPTIAVASSANLKKFDFFLPISMNLGFCRDNIILDLGLCWL